ncbi:hypothetical protein LCGC14_1324520 [marine sediment metagenome]|uniref:Uncharacterized protein n=1 Tax=marine sediment metagenome TaxID=412755 RepID=A0A0F9KJ29_9ZZZZ
MIATKTVTAANQMSSSVVLTGYFNLSISGTWVATVTVQRSFDSGDTWFNVDTFTENTQEYGLEPERNVYYRVGVKTGDFTSGEVVLRLSN